MNILHLMNFAGSSGSEKYVRTLLTRQIAQGHTVTLAYNIHGPLADEAAAAGAETVQLPMRCVLDLRAARRLAEICRQRHIEVVHTHFPRENCIAILAKHRYPQIRVVNTSHLVFSTGFAWRVLNRYFSADNAAVLCVCSEQLHTLSANGVRPERLRVVHNGIPPVNAQQLRDRYRASVRAEFGITDTAPLAVTLARFTQSKGLDVLIRAMAVLHDAVPEARLILAGEGEDFEKIRAQIHAAGLNAAVFTPGFRKDSQALLAAGDIYVNASRSGEALSFAIIEAMAMGLAPVISDAGGNPDIVDAHSDWGVQFASGDADALAKILIRLTRDMPACQAMGLRAKARAEAEFSEDKMYEETMKAYQA